MHDQSGLPSVTLTGRCSLPAGWFWCLLPITGAQAEEIALLKHLQARAVIAAVWNAGPDFITSAPCLIGTAAQGVGIQAAAINIIPQLFSITPTGDA